ncbi:hypothetical protein CHS0354_026092, partial [Potamilus streckersoni]
GVNRTNIVPPPVKKEALLIATLTLLGLVTLSYLSPSLLRLAAINKIGYEKSVPIGLFVWAIHN